MMAGRPLRQRGFALLIVLWTIGLLAILATGIVSTGRRDAMLVANIRGSAVAEAAADGAIQSGLFRLLAAPPLGWKADGRPHRVRIGKVDVELRAEDLGGRIDPNTASAVVLQAMLARAGLAARDAGTLADAVMEWRSPASLAAHGAELWERYRAAGRAWGPAGVPFRRVEELGLVVGMTPGLLARLAPHLAPNLEGNPVPELADAFVAGSYADAVKSSPAGSVDAGNVALPVIAFTAIAIGSDRSRFVRRAVLRVRAVVSDNRFLPPFEVLSWGEGED